MNFFKLLFKYRIIEILGFSFLILGGLLYAFIQYSNESIDDLNTVIILDLNTVNTEQHSDTIDKNIDNTNDSTSSKNTVKSDEESTIVNQFEYSLDPYQELPANFKLYKKSIFDFFDDNSPKLISINEIGLKSDIKELEIVDLGNSSSYETPKNIVGHIPQTVNPGEKGRSWYFGHLESFIKKEGNVFHMLPKIPELMKTDPYIFIHIKTNSKTFVYQIYKTQVIPKEELILDIESEYSEVILVTCVPSFLYHSRLLIFSKLIGTY